MNVITIRTLFLNLSLAWTNVAFAEHLINYSQYGKINTTQPKLCKPDPDLSMQWMSFLTNDR